MKRKILFVLLALMLSQVFATDDTFKSKTINVEKPNPYLNIEVTKYDNIDKNGLVKTEVSYYKKLDYLIIRVYQPNYTPYDAGIFENFYYITLQNWLRSRSESDKYYYYSTQRRTTWFNKTVNDKPCIVMDVQVILYKD